MPYADPEKARERRRRYREANADKIREYNRNYARSDVARERRRRYREANADKIRDINRTYYEANREQVRTAQRRNYEANRGQIIQRTSEYQRKYRPANRERYRNLNRTQVHGPGIDEWFAKQWALQGGRCYLHGGPMTPDEAVIDHDHSCCPAHKSCAYCRRGLACVRCNVLIGSALDDPMRLRMIADNLEAVLVETRTRIATKPVQAELPVA